MSTIKVNSVQLGDSSTASQNFVLRTNIDGTATLARGNVGATTQDVLTVGANGSTSYPQGIISNSINGGQLAGMRNRVINGDCRVDQRGARSFQTGGTLVGYGGPDRFACGLNTATGQIIQSQQVLTFDGISRKTVRQYVGVAKASFTSAEIWYGIRHPIESTNCHDLANKPITVSFIFNTNVTGTYSFALLDNGFAHSYVSTFAAVANTPTKVVVSIPAGSLTLANDSSLGLMVIVGSILASASSFNATTLNTWLTGTYESHASQVNWAATAGNFIELTELQLEEGTVATPFERRNFGAEFAMCRRYYQTGTLTICGDGVMAYATASTAITPMMATPSISVFDNIGQAGYCSVDGTHGVPAQGFAANQSSLCTRTLNYVAGVNTFIWFNYTAHAEY